MRSLYRSPRYPGAIFQHLGGLARLCVALFVAACLIDFGIAPADAAADAVEQDAQEYSRLALRHDTLLLKLNLKRITDEEQKELDAIRAQGAAIKARYAPGGPMSGQAAAFDKRLNELSVQVTQPALRGAVTDAFPSVDEVRAAYPDPARSIAAFHILADMLAEKVGKLPPPATTAKINTYRAAIAKLNPKFEDVELLSASGKLERSPEFQFEVLNRFVPVYAGDAKQASSQARNEAQAVADEAHIYRAYWLVGLAVLALPLLILIRGQRAGRGPTLWRADDSYPFQLPPQLRRAQVFRKDFFMVYDCGVVTDKRVIEETVKHTTHTQERSSAGGITVYGPGSVSSSTTTTTYHKYAMRTPDERTITRNYLSYQADAEVGHIVSNVSADGWVIAYYNHTLNEDGTIPENIEYANRFPGKWLWAACVAVAFLGLWLVQRYIVESGTHADDWRFSYMVGSLTLLAALVSPVWIWIVRRFVEKRRNQAFAERYLPQLKRFMQERTPLLQKHYAR